MLLELHPLGPHRNEGALPRLRHIHRPAVDQTAAVQFHHRPLAFDLFHRAGQHIVLADELRHKTVLRAFIKFIRRRGLLDAPVVEDHDAVGHAQRLGLVMGHIKHGDAQGVGQIGYLELHKFAQLFVQRAEGFVHQHQFRLEHEGAGQRHPLLLTAGELPRPPVAELPHLHHIQHILHPRLALGLFHPAHLQRETEVLGHRHVGEQGVVLKHHPDAAFMGRDVVDGLAVKKNPAVGDGLKARQHHQAGGLARAGRPQHGQKLPFPNGKVQILDDKTLPVITFLDAFETHECAASLRFRQGSLLRLHAGMVV